MSLIKMYETRAALSAHFRKYEKPHIKIFYVLGQNEKKSHRILNVFIPSRQKDEIYNFQMSVCENRTKSTFNSFEWSPLEIEKFFSCIILQ